jgi:hypothetical protein
MATVTTRRVPDRRRSTCSSCEQARANPVRLVVAAGIRTIHYRCPSCGRTWASDAPETESLFRWRAAS